jgi:hypothetical protein
MGFFNGFLRMSVRGSWFVFHRDSDERSSFKANQISLYGVKRR